MNYLFYDCEIIKLIPDRNTPNNPALEYCEGWSDYANMGISVIGYYSSASSFEEVVAPAMPNCSYPGDFASFELFAKEHDCVVGFNSKNFDDRLCRANGIEIETHYDLLEEIRLAAFGSRRWQDTPKGCSYSLAALGDANGFPKTGTGELAPLLWQQGKYQEVIDYCLNDVKITVRLFELGLDGGLKDPNTGKMLTIRNP